MNVFSQFAAAYLADVAAAMTVAAAAWIARRRGGSEGGPGHDASL